MEQIQQKWISMGSYCSMTGNLCTFRFIIRAPSLEDASEKARKRVMSRKNYSGKLSWSTGEYVES